jgi:hypothetical protein
LLEGGRRAAIIYSFVGTAELNDWDPQAYLLVLLDRIADLPIKCMAYLALWNLWPDAARPQSTCYRRGRQWTPTISSLPVTHRRPYYSQCPESLSYRSFFRKNSL